MRFSVVGATGSGKTTLARSMSQSLAIPHVELDGIYHQPGWSRLPETEFRIRIIEEVGRPDWVIDGNYSEVRELVWAAADAVIFSTTPGRLSWVGSSGEAWSEPQPAVSCGTAAMRV